ncbi:MAG: putative D,D-dipeptide transport system permease protein DdpC [Paracidovorax wautersii]|uniref:Putative D,D-dipeptide transport system permease protein DdpC n=1 Tax=Paracidovorax wautersii TaxID=1177982 RepID=A0A7V8FPW1_9BURK|nr:MAG: putative D,D-dipeptide transport system permease protein DdpC [Paracidovorax wautersii]
MTRARLAPWLWLAPVLAIVLVTLATPWLAPHEASAVVGGGWSEPSAQAWLGTDNLGRDLLSRMLWGARTTLGIALAATVLAFVAGGGAGLVAGVAGGSFDRVASWLNNVFLSIPTLVCALVVLSLVPANLLSLTLLVAFLESLRIFRVARALAIDRANLDYVMVARMRGESMVWIIGREILPNAALPLLAEFGLRLAFAVLLIASLSFLGLGLPPPATDWGSIAKENRDGILFGVWAALVILPPFHGHPYKRLTIAIGGGR